jgi:hypothetical protein
MLSCMKTQLTDNKLQKNKNFGFGSILCTFLFERVSMMSPRAHIREHLRSWHVMVQWTELLAWLGRWQLCNPYDDECFFLVGALGSLY